MKKTKPLTAALLCCVTALPLVLSGCPKRTTVTADTLQIAVVRKGYGSDWEKELARAFTRETGIDAQVVYDPPSDLFVLNSLEAGPSGNEFDLYCGMPVNVLFGVVAKGGSYAKGWDKTAFADLSEVYDAPAVGWKELEEHPDWTNRDIINPYITDALTFHVDNKQYGVSFAQGMEGFLYNRTLWDETNERLAAAGNAKLTLPVTTDEMFTLFNRIGGLPGSARNNAYPLKYAGTVGYVTMGWYHWWAQFDGSEKCELFLQGKDKDGIYSPEIFNYDYSERGRRYGYDVMKQLLSSGYAANTDQSRDFTTAQVEFLEKKAFFNFNGDWLERETDSNFARGDVEAGFIRVPIVSKIIDKCSSAITTDAQLQQAIDYIDYLDGYNLYGRTAVAERPSWLTDDDLKLLTDARHIVISQGMHGIATAPAYSPHLKEAKEFLKYMLSKDGQEIVMNACYGNMAPLITDASQTDYYQSPEITVMAKTRLEIFPQGTLFGRNAKYPMMYLANMELMYSFPDGQFPGATTVKAFMDAEYNTYKPSWAGMMAAAGVSNA